jgi:nitrate/nitrite-specific signal transduction histidine kinase
MGKRAESIGASLNIRSSPGEGTLVEVIAPQARRFARTGRREYSGRMRKG